MDERTEHDPPNASDAIRSEETERADSVDDDAEESSGPLTRVRSVGVEAVGIVVDAVLDAL
jgi:hypothetical protein